MGELLLVEPRQLAIQEVSRPGRDEDCLPGASRAPPAARARARLYSVPNWANSAHARPKHGPRSVVVQRLLDGQAALHGPLRRRGQVLARLGRVPEGNQGIAGELDHVAAVGPDEGHQLLEIGVEHTAKLLGADRALLG